MTTQFEQKIEKMLKSSRDWAAGNRQTAATLAAVLAAAVFIIYFGAARRAAGVTRAAEKFSAAQSMYSQGMSDRASAMFAEIISQYPSSPPAFHARIILAEMKISAGAFDEARSLALAVHNDGRPKTLRPFGLYLAVISLHEKGDMSAASVEAENFLGKYPDHFLTPRVYEKLGIIYENSSRPADARRIYERLAVLYPGSSWAARSSARIAALTEKK